MVMLGVQVVPGTARLACWSAQENQTVSSSFAHLDMNVMQDLQSL